MVQERQLRKAIAEMHDGHRAQINAVMDKYQSLLAQVSHLQFSTNKTYWCVLDYFESCHDCCPIADSKTVVEIDMLPACIAVCYRSSSWRLAHCLGRLVSLCHAVSNSSFVWLMQVREQLDHAMGLASAASALKAVHIR